MRVRILTETPYEPRKGDSQRCVGQLKKRAGRREIRFSPEKGVEDIRHECGPMQHVFPVGATPDLSDEVGAEFIACGAAVLFDGPDVLVVSAAEILDGMPTE